MLTAMVSGGHPTTLVTQSSSLLLPKIRILAESDRWCIVGKPAGMMVHRNSYAKRGEVALMQRVRDQLGRYVHPVHRLDGGTSGCLIFAYDSETTAMMQAALQSPTTRKTYLAFSRGDASELRDMTVDRPLKDDKGITRTAETHIDCLASVGDCDERSSLLRCTPVTGRFHQIRKHLNGLSHPILGDAKHGDSRVNRWWREHYEMQHLGLHCHELSLTLADGEQVDVRCPVRADLVAVWSQLPWWPQACAAVPSLVSDAEAARGELLLAAAAEDHVHTPRAAAAGLGLKVFARGGLS